MLPALAIRKSNAELGPMDISEANAECMKHAQLHTTRDGLKNPTKDYLGLLKRGGALLIAGHYFSTQECRLYSPFLTFPPKCLHQQSGCCASAQDRNEHVEQLAFSTSRVRISRRAYSFKHFANLEQSSGISGSLEPIGQPRSMQLRW